MKDNNTDFILKSLETTFRERQFELFQDILIKNRYQFDEEVFHYNLGVIHLKKKQFPDARFHLERSLNLGIKNGNAEELKSYTVHKLNVANIENDNLYGLAYQSLMLAPDSLKFTICLLLMLIILILFKLKKWTSKILLFSLVALAFIPLGLSKYHLEKLNLAIIIRDSNIREGPSRMYLKINQIPAGLKITTEKKSGNWFLIKYPKIFKGWIHENDLNFF